MANTTRTIKRPATATGNQWIDPAANPAKASADIEKAIAEANSAVIPEITVPADDTVILPGGLVRNNEVIKTIQVKELTGEDEESLAKASQSLNPFTFLDRLLKCGVVRIGSEPSNLKDKLLSQLLVGDREAIILGIRRATYGDKLDVENWVCSNCGVKENLSMELSDIPVTSMTDPANDITFKVPLRKGGFAYTRLATGADQIATFEKPELSQAQRETVLLSRCITTITDKDGKERSVAGFPSMVLSMSVPDRHAVLNELRDRQPGPRYDKVQYNCHACNEDVFVTVTIGNLFLDFGWM